MSVFFRIILVSLLFSISFSKLKSEDLLWKNINKYNKLVESKVVVDSSRVIFNLNFLRSSDSPYTSIQIIQNRNKLNPDYSFYFLLFAILVFSMLRYVSGASYKDILANFFSMKERSSSQFSVIKYLLIGCAFVSLVGYSLYLMSTVFSILLVPRFLLLNIQLSILAVIFYKYFLFILVTYIFDLKRKISEMKFIVADFMYIFVFISLPLLFFSALTDVFFVKSILIGISAIFIFLYIFMYYKIFSLNSYLLTRNVFKTLIYFYIVEIIPILLLSKYFKTFVV